jgi:antitoxin component YwqK of YwqJK toxin-antitoxin module
MRKTFQILVVILLTAGLAACGTGNKEDQTDQKEDSSIVKKRRDDGTLSSINPLDTDGYIDGVKINFYEDGKTVHSRITYEHGRKQGPALWYYKNGQVHEHTAYYFGRKHGLTKKYYDTGELMEELTYEQGEVQPGAKKYRKSGELITQ